MTPKQVNEIKELIHDSINTSVNGKINVLTQKFDDYIVADMKWKEEADPYIKGLANISGSAKIVVWLALGMSSIIGAWLAIKNILK